MPRIRRLTAPGCFHHIYNRGLNKQKIFKQTSDYQKFFTKLESLVKEYDFVLYCYVLLPNHFHLLLETGDIPLAKIMSRLLTSYSVFFNNKYKRRGPLFEDRFKSKIVQKENYFIELSRYIHLNPIKANLIKDPKTYPYSSLREILGIHDRQLIDREKINKLIGDSRLSLKDYEDFVYAGIDRDLSEFDPWENDQDIIGSRKYATARIKKYIS